MSTDVQQATSGHRARWIAVGSASGLASVAAAVLGITVLLGMFHEAALQQYSVTADAAEKAAVGLGSRVQEYDAAVEGGRAYADEVAALVAASPDGFVGATEKAEAATAADALRAAAEADADPGRRDDALPESLEPSASTDALRSATGELAELTGDLEDAADAFAEQSDAIEHSRGAAVNAATALITSIPITGHAILDANPAATNRARILFLDQLDFLEYGGTPADITPAMSAYVTAAQDVQSTHASQSASTRSPAQAAAEEFARSISVGVPLDIVWVDVIPELSWATYAGTAVPWTGDQPFAEITLMNAIARDWPQGDPMAIVAHEVGHALSSKPGCSEIFQGATFGGQQEVWATAWALSMGMSSQGAGVQAYGWPSDAQIAAAAGCR